MSASLIRSIRLLIAGFSIFLGSWALASGRPTQQITLLHWNDFHARNLPWEDTIEGIKVRVGGAAYLAALLDSLRQIEPGALLLEAGDEFTGTPISLLTCGRSQIDLLNLIRPDAFELGNHEFDYGYDTLRVRLAQAQFPLLCCNVFDSLTHQPIACPSLVLERQGVKVAIIGVMGAALPDWVLPRNMAGLQVVDPAPVVNRMLDTLERVSDVQVALTHQGIEEDVRLAKSCPRLDAIVGGHQSEALFTPRVENGIPILQAGSKGEYVGIFQALVDTVANRIVSFDGQLITVLSDSLAPRADVEALVQAQEEMVSTLLDTIVGQLLIPWVGDNQGESNVGDWTADAMVRLTGMEIAFINSGGLRQDLPAGPVRMRDIWGVHPFGNRIVGFQLTGSELARVISFQAKNPHRLLQIGGMRYRAKPATGEILELTIADQPLDSLRQYSIATNEYVAAHANDYFGFGVGDRSVTDLGWVDRDLVIRAFSQEGAVKAEKDGRMVRE